MKSALLLINSHFGLEPRATASIPVQPTDDDIQLMDYLYQAEADLAEAARLLRAGRNFLFATYPTGGMGFREPMSPRKARQMIADFEAFLARFPEEKS